MLDSCDTEKSGTYVNIDGRVLITRLAVTPPGQARNEWEIMRALSEIMGQSLPYDSLAEIRFRVAELAPHLIKYDYIEPYNFSNKTMYVYNFLSSRSCFRASAAVQEVRITCVDARAIEMITLSNVRCRHSRTAQQSNTNPWLF